MDQTYNLISIYITPVILFWMAGNIFDMDYPSVCLSFILLDILLDNLKFLYPLLFFMNFSGPSMVNIDFDLCYCSRYS